MFSFCLEQTWYSSPITSTSSCLKREVTQTCEVESCARPVARVSIVDASPMFFLRADFDANNFAIRGCELIPGHKDSRRQTWSARSFRVLICSGKLVFVVAHAVVKESRECSLELGDKCGDRLIAFTLARLGLRQLLI